MVFPEKYYRLNFILLSSIGLWPYDNAKIRLIQVILVLLIYISSLTVQFMKLFTSEYSLDLLLEIVAFNFFGLVWFIKYITFSTLMENIKQLLKRIRYNYSILIDAREIDIMHKHIIFGKRFTIFLGICVYLGCVLLSLLQYIPDLLDILKPLNESRPRMLLHQTKYFAHQDKYIHIVIMHEAIGIFIFGTAGLATETFILVNSLHALGMFRIASYRMERMLTVDVSQPAAKNCIVFHDKITAAVDIHRRAIEFSELLKTSFGLSYLLMILMAICSTIASLYRLFRIITMQQEMLELFKLFNYVAFLFIFLIIVNFVGQEVISRDDHVHRMICNTKWYNVPMKIQKLILFLMRKTVKSYKIDAAGLFNPSLEGLATTMSLLLSFLTILCSL